VVATRKGFVKTGSEVSFATRITDPKRNLKTAIASWALFPDLAAVDPEMALHLPHAIEPYVSLKAHPSQKAFRFMAFV
jgi:alcohol dehydrogenase class IV